MASTHASTSCSLGTAPISAETENWNLEDTGNTVSSTVMIALKDCVDKQIIKAGMQVMITGFGVGLSWGGTILKF